MRIAPNKLKVIFDFLKTFYLLDPATKKIFSFQIHFLRT